MGTTQGVTWDHMGSKSGEHGTASVHYSPALGLGPLPGITPCSMVPSNTVSLPASGCTVHPREARREEEKD